MPEDSTRRSFLTAAGAGIAAAVAGCAGNQPDETSTETSTPTGTEEPTATATPEPEKEYTGGTLSMASDGSIQTLDPVNAKGSGAGYNQYQESLLHFPNGDLPAQGELATDYAVSEDGFTYTFELKEGVTFHDGQELTAGDFVYSWERLAQSSNSRNKDDIIGDTFTLVHEKDGDGVNSYVPGSLAVSAVDEYTLEFEMAEAFHAVISQIAGGAFSVVPEGAVGDIEQYDGEHEYNAYFGTAGDGPNHAGTGPFQVDDWRKGDRLELSRFEEYHGEPPLIDGIVYTVLNGTSAGFKRFQNENLDVMGPGSVDFPTAKFDPEKVTIENDFGSYRVGTYGPLSNGETVNYGEATALDTTYLVFNADRTERPFRRAIAHMIDQESIAESIYKGTADPAYHLSPPPVFPTNSGADPAEAAVAHARDGAESTTEFGADGYPFGFGEPQLDEARQVMEEAGYGEDDRYQATFTVFSGSSAWQRISQRIRDKAANAHIDVEITTADFGTIISKAINGEMDMFSLGDGMEWPESDNFLRFLHPTADKPMFTRWNPPEEEWNQYHQTAENAWQQYLENKGPGEDNQVARNEAYRAIEEMNWASIQELPLVYSLSQRFWYDDVDVRMFGTMEDQTFDTLTLTRE